MWWFDIYLEDNIGRAKIQNFPGLFSSGAVATWRTEEHLRPKLVPSWWKQLSITMAFPGPLLENQSYLRTRLPFAHVACKLWVELQCRTQDLSALSLWNISVPVLWFSSKFSSQNCASACNPKQCFKTSKSLNLRLFYQRNKKCSGQSKSMVPKLSLCIRISWRAC